jgi:hypothetical protein
MKIKGLKRIGDAPEVAISKSGKKFETGERVHLFKAPDGFKGTYDKFVSEAERGRLHGLIIASS